MTALSAPASGGARGQPVFAAAADDVRFHPVLQPGGHVSLDGLAHRDDQRDGAAGRHHVLRRVGAGVKKYRPAGFWAGLCPPMDVPIGLRIVMTPMLITLEILGLLIRYAVLAVRLLANMFGGHLGLAVLLSFISMTAGSVAWYLVAPTTVLVAVAINLLELFIAVLQAYVFSFLAAFLSAWPFIGTKPTDKPNF